MGSEVPGSQGRTQAHIRIELDSVHLVTIQNIIRDGGGTITTVELGQVRKSTTFRIFYSGILGF